MYGPGILPGRNWLDCSILELRLGRQKRDGLKGHNSDKIYDDVIVFFKKRLRL